MFAVLGLIFFILGWFENGTKATGMPSWFNVTGMALLGLACLAVHGFWPIWRGPRPPQP